MKLEFIPFLTLTIALAFASCDDGDDITPYNPDSDEPQPVVEFGAEDHTNGNQLLTLGFHKSRNQTSLCADFKVDINGDTINIFIPYLVQFKLSAYFLTSDSASVYVNGYLQISDSTVADYSQLSEIKIVATDMKVHTYWVNIYNSGLPVVYINTPGNRSITSKEVWIDNTQMQVYTSTGSLDYDSADKAVQIRGRGNSTWSASTEKRPYAIKLNEKSKIMGMPKHKRWVLLANYYDATFFRNALANYLGHNYTNADWTPSGFSCELVLNGSHKGNYYFCEQARMSNKRVPGEYLVEADRKEGSGQITGVKSGNFFNIKDVANDSIEETDPVVVAYVKSILDRFETTLYGDDFLDTDSGYRHLVDLESFVDWYLIKELSKDYDGNMFTSCYCHIMADSIIRMGPIWDFDLAFGGNPFEQMMGGGFGFGWGAGGGTTDYAWYNKPEGYHIADADWYVQMFKDPDFIALLRQKVDAMVADLDVILAYIDSNTELLTLSASANKVGYSTSSGTSAWGGFGWGWGQASSTTTTVKKTYAEEMLVIKTFVSERLKWMQSDLALR